ncbi:MAG: hypothetical protein B6D46_04130 [Polyangiaceae bacterium UTPRO1]|jgi:hypothetical protein|nr:glycine zipper family protein [Myxococcales bacterium]OQY68198.1 MAG: hypothetical protein B6D46_04130 [Polyangiaceae bacterium UTPRO1]
MTAAQWFAAAASAFALAGCVQIPAGPNVMVMPGSSKSFDEFMRDDRFCRDYAASRVRPETRRTNDRAVGSAVVGSALGAAAGAAIGAAAGDPAMGAAVGAGVGLLGGSAVGADQSDYGNWSVQRLYDAAYVQCMYAHGNRVPVPAGSRAARTYSPPPPPRRVPPPPPGRPPAPPPGVGY